MKTFKLDPDQFPRIRRNIILTYSILALAGLGVFYLYIREALFGQAWTLIPFVLLLFAIAGWFALRQRKQYWDAFEIKITEQALIRSAHKLPDLKINRSEITGVKEIRQGLILSTKTRENTLLIPKGLAEADYQALKQILERWVQTGD